MIYPQHTNLRRGPVGRLGFDSGKIIAMKKIILSLTLIYCVFSIASAQIDKNKKQTILDLPYGTHPYQKMDVYLPANHNKNTRSLFYIHGGGWYAGDKNEAEHWYKYFQKSGYAVVCINYRLAHTSENNIYPSQIIDIDSAINFALNKSAEWNISKTKTIIMGASAGAQLALLYAYKFNQNKKIKAAISFCGALDLTDPKFINADMDKETKLGTILTWYLGDTITNKRRLWKDASPINHISKSSVATFFLHGKSDEKIPYQQSVRAYNALKSFAINSQLVLLENTHHDLLSLNLTDQLKKVNKFIRVNVL